MNSLIWRRKKKTSPNYFQIQGQLPVTDKQYFDFFFFSFNGHLNIRVKFDEQFWIELLDNLDWFFRNFVAPELLLGTMKKNLNRGVCDEMILLLSKEITRLCNVVLKIVKLLYKFHY